MKIFTIVPEKYVYVLERFGKFQRLLNPGISFMIPFIDQIAYKKHLMEQTMDIDKQTVITKDNVALQIDGTLFMQVEDAYKASYKIKDPKESIKLLALTVMRSEIGKLKLDQLLQQRQKINKQIHFAVNKAANEWGINCLRYQILNIEPPEDIKRSMEYQVQAERTKRRQILLAEAKKISQINVKTGQRMHAVQLAEGKAQAIKIIAQKQKQATIVLNQALSNPKIRNYILLNKYLPEYKDILTTSNIVVSPGSAGGTDSNLASILLLLNGLSAQNRVNYSFSDSLPSSSQSSKSAEYTSNPFESRERQPQTNVPQDEDLQIKFDDKFIKRKKKSKGQ